MCNVYAWSPSSELLRCRDRDENHALRRVGKSSPVQVRKPQLFPRARSILRKTSSEGNLLCVLYCIFPCPLVLVVSSSSQPTPTASSSTSYSAFPASPPAAAAYTGPQRQRNLNPDCRLLGTHSTRPASPTLTSSQCYRHHAARRSMSSLPVVAPGENPYSVYLTLLDASLPVLRTCALAFTVG